MDRNEMLKTTWKAYQEVYYQHPRIEQPILCLLIQLDFDDESMTLQPLWPDQYIKQDFIAGIQHCSIPKKKMKAIVIHNKKVNEKKEMPKYEGSSNRFNPYFTYQNPNPDKVS